jgi:predicted DNA-binding protein with PD1-like motif
MLVSRQGALLAVRLHAGEDVHGSLTVLCAEHGIGAGFVVSGIGMLESPSLGYFDTEAKAYGERTFPGRHELLSLAGNISLREGTPFAHLHVVLGNPDYSVFGGHLFSASVGLTLEVLIQAVPGAVMRRELEPEWNLPGLIIE